MSPDRSEGVFGALGWAGDRAKARALPHYAGPLTEQTNGLVPEQSGGTKPTESVHKAFKLGHVSHMHLMEIEEGQKSPAFDKVMQLYRSNPKRESSVRLVK